MPRSKYEAEWSGGALDDGSHVIKGHHYAVEISSGRASTIHTNPTSIRYNPEVNSAKRLTVKVPPNTSLEGTDYLGGTLKLVIDGDSTIEFDIKKIDTTQDDGEDYTIRAFSKGQRLTEIDTEETVNNEIAYDYLAGLVDGYNNSDEYDDFRDTIDEKLTDVVKAGGGVREVASGSSNGTAEYYNVGFDAQDLDTFYTKLYIPGTDSVDVSITDQTSTYTETIDNLGANKYGEWVGIDPGATFDGSNNDYDITFTLYGDSKLIYWRAVEDEKVERNVITPSISSVSTNSQLYSRSGTGLNSNEDRLENGVVWDSGNSVYRPRHVAEWETFASGDSNSVSDSNATGGIAIALNAGILQDAHGFPVVDKFDGWELYARHKRTTGSSGDFIDYNVEVDGSTESYSSDSHTSNYSWHSIAANDFFSSWPDTISAGTTLSVSVELADTSTVELKLGSLVLVLHGKQSPWTPNYTWDNTLHASGGHLDRPYKYYQGGEVEFAEYVAQDNISKSTADSTISNTSNPVSTWGIAQKVAINEPFPETFSNSTSATEDLSYPGVSHKTKFKLGSSGSRDTESPRKGFNRMELSDYTITVDQNDLPILYDKQVSGNNLSSMSTIADENAAFFRWEGGYARIFAAASETTSPNLREESITSSVSIEDAYDTAKVKGIHNISSPILSSANAPSWLNQHKTIRDETIETQEDAVSRCRSFLKKHGDIQFSGKINTLPTFAPVGAKISGSHFNHGQDMYIRSVSYSKGKANISLGFEMDVGNEIVKLEQEQSKSSGRNTSKGMKIPVGKENV